MRFAQDRASFSISTDDPTVTNTNLSDEYTLLSKWGLTEIQLKEAVNERKSLIANDLIFKYKLFPT